MNEASATRSRSSAAWIKPQQWLTRLFLSGCDRVGPGTRALGRPLVHNEGRIDIGADSLLRSLGSPVRLTATVTGTVTVGDRCVVDMGARVFSRSAVRIGDDVCIGPHATVSDTDERGHSGEVILERGVQIGAGARVLGPCRIGQSAIVQAGCVVRGDVAPGEIVAPAGLNGVSHPHPSKTTNGVSKHPVTPSPVQTRTVSAVLAADFTIGELAGLLATPEADGLAIRAEVAPFDQVVPTFMTLKATSPKTDVLVAWTRPDRVSPAFRDVLQGERLDIDRVLAEVDAFLSVVKAHANAARFVLLPSWVLPPGRRPGGILSLRDTQAGSALLRMNLRLAETFAQTPNVFVLDAQRWLAAARDGGFDPKLWYAGKVAFTSDVLAEAARDIFAATRALLGLSRKLVVVDLDDTMWGGIVGDVGWEGLHLGGHDPSGEAFVEFQRGLIALTKRGIALAVVSKNEESTALDAMRKHPEMLIRPEMLAAYRINWQDKAQNIVDITKELNLGLQSVVFIDDNPVERARVGEALPEVLVPEWPVDPTRYPGALDALTCLDSAHVSAEDMERNAMYATERERNSLRAKVSTLDEWLATLGLTVRFEPLGPSNVARVAQLLNKTNQMNLRTRRLSEAELTSWAKETGHEVWGIHVSDRFGDAGLTGILSLAHADETVHVEDYVLSCRVMGRRVEQTMLWAARRRGAAMGSRRIVICPIPTAKNKPCLDFFANAGVPKDGEGYSQALDLDEASPSLVAVQGLP